MVGKAREGSPAPWEEAGKGGASVSPTVTYFSVNSEVKLTSQPRSNLGRIVSSPPALFPLCWELQPGWTHRGSSYTLAQSEHWSLQVYLLSAVLWRHLVANPGIHTLASQEREPVLHVEGSPGPQGIGGR